MIPRWWLIPLLVAAVVDTGLVLRYQTSPGMAVSRAVVRTASGGACETSTLVRFNQLDSLIVQDAWTQNQQVLSVGAQQAFVPGSTGPTPQYLQLIAEGTDIQQRDPVRVAAAGSPSKAAAAPLLANYVKQMHHGAPWLQGPCVPDANPLHSHLRRLGVLRSPDGLYTVYRGRLVTTGGVGTLPKSDVWIAVRQDGRLGFELLRQLPAPGADLSLIFLARLYTYPGQQLSALATQPPAQHLAFYESDYHDLLVTMEAAEGLGPPPPPVPVPPGVPALR